MVVWCSYCGNVQRRREHFDRFRLRSFLVTFSDRYHDRSATAYTTQTNGAEGAKLHIFKYWKIMHIFPEPHGHASSWYMRLASRSYIPCCCANVNKMKKKNIKKMYMNKNIYKLCFITCRASCTILLYTIWIIYRI